MRFISPVGLRSQAVRLGSFIFLVLAPLAVLQPSASRADDLTDAQQAYLHGAYQTCLDLAERQVKDAQPDESWHSLFINTLLTVGDYPGAATAATNAVSQYPGILPLRWLAWKACRSNGQPDLARTMIQGLVQQVADRPWAYRDAANLVVIGQVALLQKADPKVVLDQIYEAAHQNDPSNREVYLARGGLALDKHDFALAARLFLEGLNKFPDDPDLNFGLARAYEPSQQTLMIQSLEATLKHNSNHIGSLLLLADHNIDAEDYEAAEDYLDRVNAVNPRHPDAWAYRAVLAHLRSQAEAEHDARSTALKFWTNNPRVDWLIGLKLSQKYRFAEGAKHQYQALAFDPDYLPAKAQLAQDLLRLGREDEGWNLANEVQREDEYDVTANNLVTLHDVIRDYTTLTNEHFIVRMQPHEASLYGQRALDLLDRARSRLCDKYGIRLASPTLVEIFHEQKDFAVRTFGLPGNEGFLGVCFGHVITANSPGARSGMRFNWESMLWHEFCHVVTLQMTHNKMPRWLSEGISVYEERQADPSWGEKLTPRYREMLLGDDLTPVSELSAAFLAPPSPEHLQFAYYESSLVVEFLVERYGYPALISILHDLGNGAEINTAIERHTEPMGKIETDFKAFAKQNAESLGPGLDWEKPDLKTLLASGIESRVLDVSAPTPSVGPVPPLSDDRNSAWTKWADSHPTNFWVMTRKATELVEDKDWKQAEPLLRQLVELCPQAVGRESAYAMLATTYRALGETNQERRILTQFAQRDDEALEAYRRLMEIGDEESDWSRVEKNARRYLAVNPLVALPHRYLAEASEKEGETQTAIEALKAWLTLDPPNPAEVHFRLARLLHQTGDPAARRQVLEALENAPRYREALQLLLQINQSAAKATRDPHSTEGFESATADPIGGFR